MGKQKGGGGEAAKAEAMRRREEAEARKRAAAEEEAAAVANGMGVFMHKGNRSGQEDRAATMRLPLPGFARLAAVYDGHVGDGCAEYAVEQVPFVLQQTAEFSAGDYGAALVKTLEATHAMWLREAPPSDESGSLATLALLANGELYVASLGNGRCIVCSKDGQATGLAGNREKNDIPHRGLFGPEQPSVECAAVALGPSDAFVLLASDGVWDVFSSSKAGEIVARSLQADPKAPHKAAKALCDAAYNAESDDNISAAVLVCEWDSYPPPPPPTEPPRPKPTAVATAKPAAAVAAVAKPKATAVAASAKPVATAVAATAKPAATAVAATAKPAATAVAATAKPAATAVAAAAKPAAVAARQAAATAVAAAAKPARPSEPYVEGHGPEVRSRRAVRH